jgi:hypothetical protein
MPPGYKAGGRDAGTPNKATMALRQLVEDAAGGPLPVLLAKAGRTAAENGDVELAVLAWSKAASFIYGRPKASEDGQTFPAIVVVDGVPNLDQYPGPIVHVNFPRTTDDVVVFGDRVLIDDIDPMPT